MEPNGSLQCPHQLPLLTVLSQMNPAHAPFNPKTKTNIKIRVYTGSVRTAQ